MKKIVLFICFLVHACSYAGPKVTFDFELTVSAIFNNDAEAINLQLKHLIIGYAKLSRMKNPTTIKDALLKEHTVPQIAHKKLKENDQFNLIMIAAFKGNVGILTSIIKAIPIPEGLGNTKSEHLNKQNKKVRMACISEYLNKQNNNGRTALMLAGLSGSNETIQYLLSQEPDIKRLDFNDRGFDWYFSHNLLIEAIVANNRDAIDLYLPLAWQKSPKKYNHLVINQQINREFERPEDERITPLMAIAAKIPEAQTEDDKDYFINLAKLFISCVDTKRTNNYNRTALMYAIAANNNPITELLMAKEEELLEQQRKGIPQEHATIARNESESSTFTIHSSDES